MFGVHSRHAHASLASNKLVDSGFEFTMFKGSAVFAASYSFLHQPFDSLWIYFVDINKAYSAVLLSELNISGEKKQQT